MAPPDTAAREISSFSVDAVNLATSDGGGGMLDVVVVGIDGSGL